MNSLHSGITEDAAAKIHRTVRCANSVRANGRQRDQRQSTSDAWLEPTVPGRTGLSDVHQTLFGLPRGPRLQWSASPNKERNHAQFMSGGTPDCPVRPRTEGKNCLPNGAPTSTSCLGAIKGTLRHMEQNPKPPLNILRRLDSARTHPICCV
jgi:hypothetical protein